MHTPISQHAQGINLFIAHLACLCTLTHLAESTMLWHSIDAVLTVRQTQISTTNHLPA